MQLARYKLTGARSITLNAGRIFLHQDECVVLPRFLRHDLPSVFELTAVEEGYWPVCLRGGLGDKIYFIPVLYEMTHPVGVEKRDYPLFRLVRDRIRPKQKDDVNCLAGLTVNGGELTDQIAANLDMSLTFKLPVLETTPQEKEQVKDLPADYVLFCRFASMPDRSWPEGEVVANELRAAGVPVIEVVSRNCSVLPLAERASCVITTNTSLIPMAGGFQVPLVAVKAPRRTGYFLDACSVGPKPAEALESYHRIINSKRLRCWCDETSGVLGIKSNLWTITCSKCGTVRQDAKLTAEGISDFYRRFYHAGWRQIVEREKPYESRFEVDLELATQRLKNQWAPYIKERGNWLDVGCANGALLAALNVSGFKAEGLEYSMPLGEKASRASNCRVHASWDGAGLYDVISYCDVIEHGFPKEELVQSIEHLSPQGWLIVEVPIAEEEPKHYRRLQHLFFFTEETFKALANDVGLRTIATLTPIKGKRTFLLRR